MSYRKVLAFVLAGGKGERLFPLTAMRSKPAVPFGGRYRIVDFALSNLVNSHIYSIYMLIQYKSQSLIEHIRQHWALTSVIKDNFIALVPPQMRMGPEWFQGTADAVFQNITLIRQHDPELVLVFGADHVYRMDIRKMIDFHLASGADATVAARPQPIKEATKFGVIHADQEGRIIKFQEKPRKPAPMPGNPEMAYISMGNYIFDKEVLIKALVSAQRKKHHDFGAHVIPTLVDSKKRVFAYDFASNVIPGAKPYEEHDYWRDVGTLKAYYDSNMDLLGAEPRFDLDNRQWPVHPSGHESPSTRILRADIRNCLLAEGITIHGGRLRNSIIRSGVVIEEDVVIEDSIVMNNVVLKRGSRLKNAIVDKLNVIGEDEHIGFGHKDDHFRCHTDSSGIVVLPRGGRKKRKKK